MSLKTDSITRGLWMGLFIAIIVISAKALLVMKDDLPFIGKQKTLQVYGEIPGFELISQEGEKFTAQDLQGKVWIANFIFTRCGGPCPIMSGTLKRIHSDWKHEDRVHFISFSVDPEYDQPPVLKQYANRFNAGPHWSFLTGEKETIFKLSEQHFYLGAGEIPEEDRKSFGHRIHHSSKFVLVDGQSRIRGYYDSLDTDSLKQLGQDIKGLLK